MSADISAPLAVHKSILVAAPVERAFELFTDGVSSWWPQRTHSVNHDEVETVVIEPREGGRMYERTRRGEEAHWALVRAWEPPHRLVLEWAVNPQDPPTQVEVRFTADGEGTRVELTHTGWEAYGDGAAEGRAGYDEGWGKVLERFADAV
jgi:uncharacterized protein YndB with AHSA1/START domain